MGIDRRGAFFRYSPCRYRGQRSARVQVLAQPVPVALLNAAQLLGHDRFLEGRAGVVHIEVALLPHHVSERVAGGGRFTETVQPAARVSRRGVTDARVRLKPQTGRLPGAVKVT